jgi:DHA3 family tetracycline resistance protein-like MFS transporter
MRVHLTRSFLHTFAQTLVFATWMVYQIQVIGLDALQLVLIGTAMEVTIFLFEIPTGVLADVYSRRLSVIIGTALMGVGFLVMAAFPVFAAALVSQFIWGVGFTFTSGAYDAWMVDEVGQEGAGRAFMRGNQIGRIAGLLGIVVSTALATISLSLPIYAGGALQLMLAALLIVIMPERGFKPTPREERNSWHKWFGTFAQGLALVRSRPMLWSILGIGFFFGLFSEAWDRLWQAHLIETIGLPPVFEPVVWIGILTGIEALLGVALLEVLTRRLDTGSARQMTRVMFILTACMVASQLVFALSPSLLLAVLMFYGFTLARGLIDPVFSTWSNQHIESDVRATVLSMQSQTDAIGQIAGGPPLGRLGQISLRWALSASAFTLSPALLLIRRVARTEARNPVRQDEL